MEYSLASQKINDNTHLVKVKHTNEPVAILTSKKSPYGGKPSISVAWHPTFKTLHPEVHDNLMSRNFPRQYDSLSAATNVAEGISEDIIKGTHHRKDAVRTEYAGEDTVKNADGVGVKYHTWHMHDDDNHRIGKIFSKQGPDDIHVESPVSVQWRKEYIDSVPESVKEAARKKHSKDTLSATFGRVRYIIDNKGKEPRFIGTISSKDSGNNIFKTKLSPEAASTAYEEHLKKKLGADFTFTRHAPTMFSAHSPANGIYGSASHHHVISMPGELHHITSRFDHPEYSSAKKNTQVIESCDVTHHRRVILEDYIDNFNMMCS